jgi:hypothetical protein
MCSSTKILFLKKYSLRNQTHANRESYPHRRNHGPQLQSHHRSITKDSVLPPANGAESVRHYKTTKTTASMTTEEVTCRVCLKDCPNTAIETRLLWARGIAKEFLSSKSYDSVRPWEFILNLDGTVEYLAVPPSKSHHDKVYLARFRISPGAIGPEREQAD